MRSKIWKAVPIVAVLAFTLCMSMPSVMTNAEAAGSTGGACYFCAQTVTTCPSQVVRYGTAYTCVTGSMYVHCHDLSANPASVCTNNGTFPCGTNGGSVGCGSLDGSSSYNNCP